MQEVALVDAAAEIAATERGDRHRRGKRHDPLWETTALSIAPLLEHAAEVLG